MLQKNSLYLLNKQSHSKTLAHNYVPMTTTFCVSQRILRQQSFIYSYMTLGTHSIIAIPINIPYLLIFCHSCNHPTKMNVKLYYYKLKEDLYNSSFDNLASWLCCLFRLFCTLKVHLQLQILSVAPFVS